ncbi:MAG: Rnase Y domain-containing protein [Chloroflexota bacterium]
MEGLVPLLAIVVAVAGLAAGFLVSRRWPRSESGVRDDLLTAVHTEREDRLRVARTQALEQRSEAEADSRQALGALEETLHRLVRREERLEGRIDTAAARETALDQKEAQLSERADTTGKAIAEQVAELERIGSLTTDAARARLLEEVAPSAREPAAARAEAVLALASQDCRAARARPAALAIQRASGEMVGEFALVSVPIPREEVKGRIIGREGRNIKAFEAATGVELVIDDAPDTVTLSGFDPIRREVARLALLDLVEDGRIHPGRIEEAVKHARDDLLRSLRDDGTAAAESAGVGQVSAEIAELLGRLQLMRGDSEDALRSAVQTANVAAAFATELKAEQRVARRAALLYNVGLAAGREAGGSILEISSDVLTRAGESGAVVAAMAPVADLYSQVTAEQASVWLARMVRGAGLHTRDESPVRRVDSIERAAAMVESVTEPLAFQVGARVLLLIRLSEASGSVDRALLGLRIIERIEASLGPRAGLNVAFLIPGRRRQDAADGHQGRQGSGRPPFRGRSGRRG